VDTIHEHIHFRNSLSGNDRQNELFGQIDLLLVTLSDLRANALSRPFDGFGVDFQPCQQLHRFAGGHEGHLGAQHCLHAPDTR